MEIISADLHLDVLIFFYFFFQSVHLGNHEAVMLWNLIVVTAGKFAWDDILSSMPVGHLLGSNLTGWEINCVRDSYPLSEKDC